MKKTLITQHLSRIRTSLISHFLKKEKNKNLLVPLSSLKRILMSMFPACLARQCATKPMVLNNLDLISQSYKWTKAKKRSQINSNLFHKTQVSPLMITKNIYKTHDLWLMSRRKSKLQVWKIITIRLWQGNTLSKTDRCQQAWNLPLQCVLNPCHGTLQMLVQKPQQQHHIREGLLIIYQCTNSKQIFKA